MFIKRFLILLILLLSYIIPIIWERREAIIFYTLMYYSEIIIALGAFSIIIILFLHARDKRVAKTSVLEGKMEVEDEKKQIIKYLKILYELYKSGKISQKALKAEYKQKLKTN